MKKLIQESFALLITNRYLVVLSSTLVLLAIGFAIYIGINVRPSELQLVSHYSAFGVTHLYRDQWFYLLTFGVFGIFAAVMHVILAAKLFMVKGPSLAIMFAWMGVAIILLAWATAYSVINVWSPV
jgi:hypothetical protein